MLIRLQIVYLIFYYANKTNLLSFRRSLIYQNVHHASELRWSNRGKKTY